MRCPSCLAQFANPVDSCSTCGFALGALDKKFGTVPRNFRHITDDSAFFETNEHAALEKRMVEIERNFPGLNLTIVTMEVHPQFNPREYLFWLVNRCQFSPMKSRLENSFVVVLFFDSQSRTVFLTTGLGLHAALPEEKLDEILQTALPAFSKERFFEGTTAVLNGIRRQLLQFCSGRAQSPAVEKSAGLQTALKPAEETF